MVENFVDLCTAVYVLVDDCYGTVVGRDRRPGPQPLCSASEVLTLTLVAELVGLEAETRFLAEQELAIGALQARPVGLHNANGQPGDPADSIGKETLVAALLVAEIRDRRLQARYRLIAC